MRFVLVALLVSQVTMTLSGPLAIYHTSAIQAMSEDPILYLAPKDQDTLFHVIVCTFRAETAAPFRHGGEIQLQYGSSTRDAIAASTPVPAELLTALPARPAFAHGTLPDDARPSRVVGQGLYLTNHGRAFIEGEGSSLLVTCLYSAGH